MKKQDIISWVIFAAVIVAAVAGNYWIKHNTGNQQPATSSIEEQSQTNPPNETSSTTPESAPESVAGTTTETPSVSGASEKQLTLAEIEAKVNEIAKQVAIIDLQVEILTIQHEIAKAQLALNQLAASQSAGANNALTISP